jgi:Ni,Fe-hydrogenase I cytochrome b subunit
VLKKLRNDNRGVGWVIGVAVISILFLPFVYFPLSYTWDQFYAVVSDGYVFTGVYASAIRVVQIIISYLLVFSLLFVVNWAIVQAKARRYNP